MSSMLNPNRRASAGTSSSKSRFARPNAIRAMREREERRLAQHAAASQSASSSANRNASVAVPARQQCVNKACPKPDVVDGTCRTCGRVADDSNIVAEVQFGETSSGAAMVQGSFIAADQAGVRSMGPAFRRVGGSEDREKSIREARGLIQGYAQQLNVSESLVTAGTQVFKLASGANFIQGRTLASVAAVCLYAACRAEPPCKVMLIDLADLVQLNVFKLGRIFKKLNEVVPIGNDGLIPVYPEDLIWRFATKMEFHQDTAKVAEDAVRLVKRMSRDWMVMGRRPSGICGACLLMAARMHNFRRTVREVVYIVKVTNHTIQNRLQEFNVTESSQMSVEDFLKQDFLESSHDPPSFYRKSEDSRRDKSRKRRRDTADAADGEDDVDADTADAAAEESEGGSRKAAEGGADLSKVPAIKFRRDADGFIIPPLPSQIPKDMPTVRPPGMSDAQDGQASDELERLAHQFGDAIDQELDEEEEEEEGEEEEQQQQEEAPNTQPRGRKGKDQRPARPQLPINEEWEEDEAELEGQIEEIFNDPLTYEHALAYSNAEQRARIHTHWALQQRPNKAVSMSADVTEDEFADDPEVANCLLSPEEARIKELIWVNQNKDWLRQHQEKVFRRKVEADRPKQTRKRRKRARMGEGQTSPASSAAEAAINVAKDRAWSKRINYDAIRSIFDIPNAGGLGSAATSRKTSVAGSTLGVEDDDDDDEQEQGGLGHGQMREAVDTGAEALLDDDDEEEEEVEEDVDVDGEDGEEFAGGFEDDDGEGHDAEYGLEEE